MFLEIIKLLINNTFFMGSYSNEVFKEPLSNKEETEYITKMKQGDKEARSKLIEHNLRLVAHIVKKFEATGHDVDDLIGTPITGSVV